MPRRNRRLKPRAARRAAALQRLELAHLRAARSARLTRAERRARKAPRKQETPSPARPEVSTAHPVVDTEVRAARAQFDTSG